MDWTGKMNGKQSGKEKWKMVWKMEKLHQTRTNLMIENIFPKGTLSVMLHFCCECLVTGSKRKYICYLCWAEINMCTLWSNFMFILCQFAMLNFLNIILALQKCSPNVKHIYCYKQMDICYFVTHFVTNLSGEHILFF